MVRPGGARGPGAGAGAAAHRPLVAVVVVACLLVSLLADGGSTPAEAAVGPAIVDLVPAPGEVVSDGLVRVEALLRTDLGVGWTELRIDGVVTAHRLVDAGGVARTLLADVHLAHGHHRIEVRFADTLGTSAGRGWWTGVSDLSIGRIAGEDRVATAVAISRQQYPHSRTAPAAVLARMDDFPDALGSAPLAAQVSGPLLLSARDALPIATAQELLRVLAPGAEVHLLGGVAALSGPVERQVRGLGFVTRRHAGADRYGTAVAVAELVPESSTAVVASAWSFPDALAVSAPAARDGLPILLTGPDRLPSAVRDLMIERRFDLVHVIGGQAVIGEGVLAEIDAVAGTVRRAAGPTRYETAAAVTSRFFGSFDSVVVASGERFPDALSGGPYAAARGSPLLLTPPGRLAASQTWLGGPSRPSHAVLLGGTAAVGRSIEPDLRRAHLGSATGPRETAVQPAPESELSELADVETRFDRTLHTYSSMYATLDGKEIPARVELHGGTLVLRPEPIALAAGHTYALRVVVAGYDGAAWRHLDHTLRVRGATRSPPGLITSLLDDGASGVAPGELAVALTFDDGPHATYTPQILDILDRYGATATFFVTGSLAERHSLLTREIARRGHVVTNHTWNHQALTRLTDLQFAAEVDPTTRTITELTGQSVYCVRPPYGDYDSLVVARLASRGLHTAMWTVDSQDWTRPGAHRIAQLTLDGLHPGAVVLFHDGGGDRSQTVAALPVILEGLRAAGYRTATLCR